MSYRLHRALVFSHFLVFFQALDSGFVMLKVWVFSSNIYIESTAMKSF